MEYPSVEVRGVTVAQFPNPPLGAAIVGGLVSAFADGTAEDISSAVFYVGISAWAYDETVYGVNRFRRALGVGGLIFATASLAHELGAF